ncbi:nicotinamide riboside kinase, partial [Chaetomidium leptoderma]
MDQPRTVVIGISGCSSSGKTTLARLLRDIFPETFILHEDDFYKAESELPIKEGLADWDCPEAISIPDLEAALVHIHETGTFPVSSDVPTTSSSSHRRSNHGCCPPNPSLSPNPSTTTNSPPPSPNSHPQQPTLDSKEDLNTVGPCPATPHQIARATAAVQTWLSPGHPGSLIFPPSQSPPSRKKTTKICLLDGFLLFSPPPNPSLTTTTPTTATPFARVTSLLDIKLFLQVSRAKAVQRREARDGYVTMEGFWKDPPGYVEKVVWPNYVEAHRW